MATAIPVTMRYLGTDDSVSTCDCCGRSDLKSTVEIETESGDVVHFGVVCAARALKVSVKEVKAGTVAADNAKELAERRAREAAWTAKDAALTAWLWARAPILGWDNKPDRRAQVEALGGVKAIRALGAPS